MMSQITALEPGLREGRHQLSPSSSLQVPEDEFLSKGQQHPETSSDKTPKLTAHIAWGLIFPFCSVNVNFCIHNFLGKEGLRSTP